MHFVNCVCVLDVVLFVQGHPWMESLIENRPLLYSLLASVATVAALASGQMPDLAQWFELTEFPMEVRRALILTL